MQVFVMRKDVGTKINKDVNAKNRLTKKDSIKDLFGVLVNVNMGVINRAV